MDLKQYILGKYVLVGFLSLDIILANFYIELFQCCSLVDPELG